MCPCSLDSPSLSYLAHPCPPSSSTAHLYPLASWAPQMIANSRNDGEGDPQVLDQWFGTELSQGRRNPSKRGPGFCGTQEVQTTQPPQAGLWGTLARWGGEVGENGKGQMAVGAGSGCPITSSLCPGQMKAVDPQEQHRIGLGAPHPRHPSTPHWFVPRALVLTLPQTAAILLSPWFLTALSSHAASGEGEEGLSLPHHSVCSGHSKGPWLTRLLRCPRTLQLCVTSPLPLPGSLPWRPAGASLPGSLPLQRR